MKKDKTIIAVIGVVAVGLIGYVYFTRDKKTNPVTRVTPSRQTPSTAV